MYWLQKETPIENRLSGLLHLRETKIFFLIGKFMIHLYPEISFTYGSYILSILALLNLHFS